MQKLLEKGEISNVQFSNSLNAILAGEYNSNMHSWCYGPIIYESNTELLMSPLNLQKESLTQ